MRILLSAFACAPNTGSEAGVGWRWALELAKEHDVTVVTDVTRRASIESVEVGMRRRLRFVYYRPFFLRWCPLNSKTAQMLYMIWQFCLPALALRLGGKREFDVAMHITYGVFRHPVPLGLFGLPLVLGPVGGGEDAPWSLKTSITGRGWLKEVLRFLANKVALIDPILWLSLAQTRLILVKTEETAAALPWPFRRRALVYQESGIDTVPDAQPRIRIPGEPLRLLFAGRLLGWKGVHLALRGLALARERGVSATLAIVGSGPYETELRHVTETSGVSSSVNWRGHISQQELLKLYGEMHGLLFPSLHDSGGNVVLEAQAHGLPVVCLDLGGPPTLVTTNSAIVVSTDSADEDDVVDGIAAAIAALDADEGRRLAMGRAAVAHASTMSWEERVSGALALMEKAGI